MRAAKSCPIRPSPTTPTVFSAISTPTNLLRFHSPATIVACAAGICRATDSSNATACSAAVMMLDCGALTTSTPRAVDAGTSTLSRPIPARATTFRFGAAASASASIVVADRISTASASARAGSSAARSEPSTWRMSKPDPNTSMADWASFSAINTIGLAALDTLCSSPSCIVGPQGDPRPTVDGARPGCTHRPRELGAPGRPILTRWAHDHGQLRAAVPV